MRRLLRLLAALVIAGVPVAFLAWDVNPAHATDAGYNQITPTCEIPAQYDWEAQYVITTAEQDKIDLDPWAYADLAQMCADWGTPTTYTTPSEGDVLGILVTCNPETGCKAS